MIHLTLPSPQVVERVLEVFMDIGHIILGFLATVFGLAAAYFYARAQKLSGTHELLDRSEKVLVETLAKKDAEIEARIKAESEVQFIKKQMADWEKTKDEHLKAAKASMLETASQLSNKLLDDHKRESKLANEEREKNIKQTTEEMMKNFKVVSETMSNLHERVNTQENKSEIIHRSLLSPSGAGNLSEITLANIFKSSGLIENLDYKIQHYINAAEGGLKPDAIVYLPGNSVMVIDSKASKFFTDLGMEKNPDKTKELEAQLKNTMNNHLKDLVKRDYKTAIDEDLKKADKIGKVNHVVMLMFLPSESALEKLRNIDSGFEERAWKEQIIPVGPAGLVNALLQAKLMISNFRQDQNTQVIINEVKNLIGSIAKLQDLSSGIGKSIKSAFDKYDKFAASFNGNFLSKAKKLGALGISAPKDKDLPRLERYQIVSSDSLIEVEAEENEEEKEMIRLEGGGN